MPRFERPVRMPLQTGGTAYRSILFSFMLVPFAWGVIPALVILLFFREARQRRACDVVLDRGGVRVEGGPHAGVSWRWTDPALATTELRGTQEMFVQVGDQPAEYVQQLAIDGIVIAEVADADEYSSLSTLAEVLRGAGSPDAPRAAPEVDVDTCGSCGAPLVPADEDAVTCPYCGSREAVPLELRQRIRIAAEADLATTAVRQSVVRAMRGGGARDTNRALAWFGASNYLTILLGVGAWLGVARWAALVPAVLPFVAGAYARSSIAHRRALRALVVGCAAIAPSDPAHPSLCRSCRAPLPRSDQAVVTCVYCRTANVLGVSLGRAAEAAAAQGELESAIASQRRTLRTSRAVAVAAVVAAAAWVMVHL